ncbi:uncharacterized [Tachysurus ichikawai]
MHLGEGPGCVWHTDTSSVLPFTPRLWVWIRGTSEPRGNSNLQHERERQPRDFGVSVFLALEHLRRTTWRGICSSGVFLTALLRHRSLQPLLLIRLA